MEFLRKLFSKGSKSGSSNIVSKGSNIVLEDPVNWKECQNTKTSSSIGGPFRIDKSSCSQLLENFFAYGRDLHLFSPSGRYILENVYRRRDEFNRNKTLRLKDETGMGPLLEIIDFSSRKAQLYANEKLIECNQFKFHEKYFFTWFHCSYWISDVQLVIVYLCRLEQLVQCLYTIDYETNTYMEEMFEYMEKLELRRPRTPPNPLFINNTAYLTLLYSHNLYLIPWIPSRECKHVSVIELNRWDPILRNGDYRLVVGQETIHAESFFFIYGSKAYFYIENRRGEAWEYEDLYYEQVFETGVTALADRMVYIDFSKFKDIDLTKVNHLPFELAYFTRDLDIDYGLEVMSDNSTTYSSEESFESCETYESSESYKDVSLPRFLNLSCFRQARYINFYGRYITYTSDSDYKSGFIFDLETMTWAELAEHKWIPDADSDIVGGPDDEELFFNGQTVFHIPQEGKSEQGFEFRCAEILLGQPQLKSLADICRQKLIYSQEVMNVPPELFKIIFPSS